MPVPAAAVIGVSVGSKVLGGLFGGKKRRKAANRLAEAQKQAQIAMAKAGRQNIRSLKETFQGVFEQLQDLPELDIDTTFAEQAYADAQKNAESQFGRALGEEDARDSVRETTANAIGRARQVGGSTSDVLGAISEVSDSERSSFRDIDIASIGAREGRIQNALNRLQGAAQSRRDFFMNKELSEFQADTSRKQQLADFQLTQGTALADAKLQAAINNINAGLGTAQAGSAVDMIKAQNIQNIFQTGGDVLGRLGFGLAKNEFDLDSLF